MDWQVWLTMGGYAYFVWPSYLIGLVILIWNAYIPIHRHRQFIKHLKL